MQNLGVGLLHSDFFEKMSTMAIFLQKKLNATLFWINKFHFGIS